MAGFKFYCSQCGQKIEADESFCGQIGVCPNCNNEIMVPDKHPKQHMTRCLVAAKTQLPEKTLIETQPSAANFIIQFIFCGIGAIAGVVLAASDSEGISGGSIPAIGVMLIFLSFGVLIRYILICSTTKYTITNTRVISESGIFSTSLTSVYYRDIRAVSMQRVPIQTMANLASIVIATAATADAEIVLFGIAEWERVMEILNSYRDDGS